MNILRLFAISCLLIFSSCGLVSIKGSFRGLTSYYGVSKKECGASFHHEKTLSDFEKDSAIVKITNGKVVQQHLAELEKSLVYIWAPNCHGSACLNPNILRKKCESQNLHLVIVAEADDCKQIALCFDKANPMVGIDTHYYKTDFTEGYLKKFVRDLTGNKNYKSAEGRYLYFENGKYVGEKSIFE